MQIRKLYGCINIKLLQSRIIHFNRILQKYFARYKHILNVLIVSRASRIFFVQNISIPSIFFYFSCYCKQLTSATNACYFVYRKVFYYFRFPCFPTYSIRRKCQIVPFTFLFARTTVWDLHPVQWLSWGEIVF